MHLQLGREKRRTEHRNSPQLFFLHSYLLQFINTLPSLPTLLQCNWRREINKDSFVQSVKTNIYLPSHHNLNHKNVFVIFIISHFTEFFPLITSEFPTSSSIIYYSPLKVTSINHDNTQRDSYRCSNLLGTSYFPRLIASSY
jgi:hypothetical protein